MKRHLMIGLILSTVLLGACKSKNENKAKSPNILKVEKKQSVSQIVNSKAQTENWIGVEAIVGDAEPVTYKQDKSFQGRNYKDVIYLASFSNGNICALNKDKSVLIINTEGNELLRFKPDLKGKIATLAIDEQNQIHIFSNEEKEVNHKVRGRNVSRKISLGVVCTVFDRSGKQLNQIELDTLKSATGARVVGDRYVVSDAVSKSVAIFVKNSGKSIAVMDGMRQCGGVLDVSVSPNNEILVSNLGSFRVELFNLNGKRLGAFGERGKELRNFHGCCNPVTLTNLTNGAVVSVEKFPTRIKVYSKDGVQNIPVAKELKGCKYMPFTSDKENKLYVGASKKGLVKYIPQI